MLNDIESLSLDEKVSLILKTVIKTNADVSQLHTSVEELKTENKNLKLKIETLEHKINIMESQNRQNCLVFYGIKEDENEDQDKLETKISDICQNKLKINILSDHYEKVHRLGTNTNKKRPVMVKFLSYKTKSLVLKNVKNLANTGYFVSAYYSTCDQEQRKKLIPYLVKAKNKGDKTYIKNNKLIINNKEYTLDDCETIFKTNANELEEDPTQNVNPIATTSKSTTVQQPHRALRKTNKPK